MSEDSRAVAAARQRPAAGAAWLPGGLRALLGLPNDDPRKTLAVALMLCLVCSVVVSSAAVLLRPMQDANRALDRKRNILAVVGLYERGADVDALFQRFEARAVDLSTGRFTDAVDPERYEQRRAAADPAGSVAVPRSEDTAGIGRRARVALVYLLRDGDTIRQVVLPVHGYGLWSTLYGFLSLEGNLNTVAGIRFYEHAETPGLGGEVDNPLWRDRWRGKAVFGEDGSVRLRVIKGAVDTSRAQAVHEVDGLAGATLTARGVSKLIQYWLGEQGFGPFLANLREGKA